jgi:hypothetical protein
MQLPLGLASSVGFIFIRFVVIQDLSVIEDDKALLPVPNLKKIPVVLIDQFMYTQKGIIFIMTISPVV